MESKNPSYSEITQDWFRYSVILEGQNILYLKYYFNPSDVFSGITILSKEEKKQQQKQQLKEIKKKYGLKVNSLLHKRSTVVICNI